ncbi:hypothetical protein AVEN_202443-1 [Araneus ventricosus]|uniref:Uncharacterized protein n=1 Tax=Araneus ventricosus TaxID=182803 RepID=A0A4Y2X0B0_ARAVE|nr:hypothetical protein AVEN_202443-1 [Araneus ventricosus]
MQWCLLTSLLSFDVRPIYRQNAETTDALTSPRATSILPVQTNGNNANRGRNSWKDRPLERSLRDYHKEWTLQCVNLRLHIANATTEHLSKISVTHVPHPQGLNIYHLKLRR